MIEDNERICLNCENLCEGLYCLPKRFVMTMSMATDPEWSRSCRHFEKADRPLDVAPTMEKPKSRFHPESTYHKNVRRLI